MLTNLAYEARVYNREQKIPHEIAAADISCAVCLFAYLSEPFGDPLLL